MKTISLLEAGKRFYRAGCAETMKYGASEERHFQKNRLGIRKITHIAAYRELLRLYVKPWKYGSGERYISPQKPDRL